MATRSSRSVAPPEINDLELKNFINVQVPGAKSSTSAKVSSTGRQEKSSDSNSSRNSASTGATSSMDAQETMFMNSVSAFLNQATFQDKNTKSETIDHEHEKICKLNEYQRQCAEQLEEGQDSPDMQEYLRQKIKQLRAERKALIEAQRLAF
jgi:hypothetical protein